MVEIRVRFCSTKEKANQVVSIGEGVLILSLSLTHLEGRIRLALKSNVRKEISNAADGTNNWICLIDECPSKAS